MGIMDVLAELNDLDTEKSQMPETPAQTDTPEDEPEILRRKKEAPAPEPEISLPEEVQILPSPSRKPLRPEWILGMVAAAAALLLGIVFFVSRPYFPGDEDPEALLHQQHAIQATAPPEKPEPEPVIEETEPENPTIPPERNPYDKFDFQYNRHNYLLLQNVRSSPGIDVSAFQGNIDWEQVKASGIEFAIIRLGYRGYESGKLVEDAYAKKNLQGAAEAGIKIGAYFFSQALNIRETDEEIAFMLKILGDTKLDMPIVLDWEIPADSARTRNMDATTLTDIQRHFCGQMRDKGYQPMIYFNWYQSEHLYVLHDLEEYAFWLALYSDRMTYPWKVEMWQYSDKGKVPGIQGNVDLNVYMPEF